MRKITFVCMLFIACLGWQGHAQFVEGFEDGIPPTWNTMEVSGTPFVTNAAIYHGGGQSVYHDDTYVDNDAYLITEGYTIQDGISDLLGFWYYQNYADNYYSYSGVWISTASNDPITNPGDFVELQEFDSEFGYSEDEWTEYTLDLSAYEGQTVYIAFKYTGYGNHEFYMDDFSLSAVPACIAPTDLTATIITSESTMLSWTSDGDTFDISWGEGTFDAESGTIVNGFENGGTLSDLTADTAYQYYVRNDCGATDGTSTWAGPYSFYTGYCAPTSSTNIYRISGVSTEGGWTNISNLENGTTNAYSDYSTMTVSQSVGGTITYTVNASSSSNGIKIWVDYNQDFVFDDDELVASHTTYASSGSSLTGTISIAADQALGDYRMRIRSNYYNYDIPSCGDAQYGYGEAEDYTLSVVTPPSCLQPTSLSLDSIGQNSADVSWAAGADETAWDVIYGELGFDPETAGTTINVETDPSTTLSDLDADSNYEFYVKAVCGVGDESTLAGPISFKTENTTIEFISSSYNQDVIGEGNGPIEDFTTIDFDGEGYYLISETYQSPSETEPADFGLPTNRLLENQLAEGPNYYQLQDYTGNNAFQLRANTDLGSLQFSNPAAVAELYLLVTSAGAASTISGTIDFQDGTHQAIGDIDIPDWFNSTDLPIAYQGFGRLSPDGDYQPNSTNPRFYQVSITVDPANANKMLTGISLNRTDTNDGVFSLMAVEGLPTPSCLAPVNLASAELTATSVVLTWDAEPLQTQWTVVYGATGFDPETEGTSVTVNDDPNTTVSDLTANTDYEVYVKAICGVGNESTWAGPVAFTTFCNPVVALPYTENFDSYGTGSAAFPDCWERPATYISGSTWPSIVSHGSSNSLKFQSAVGTPTYAVSPAFAEDINNLRVSFILEREGASSGTIDVGVMSDPLDPNTFELVQTIDPSNTDDFVEYTFNLNLTTLTGGNNHIALRHNSDSAYWYYWLDDFVVELLPSCVEPSDLTADTISSTLADISWTAGADETAWNISWGTPGYTPGDENELGTGNSETTSYQITDLTSVTDYEFYIQADCGGGDTSAWTGPFAFKTQYACGDVFTDTGGTTGSYSPYENLTFTFYPDIVGNIVTLDFTMVSLETCCDDLSVYNGVGTDGTVLAEDLTAPESFTSTDATGALTVTFNSDSGLQYAGWEASIICTAPPTCPEPSDLTVDTVNATSADISWTAGDEETAWNISWGTPGFTPGDENELGTGNSETTSYQIEDLTANTNYDVYVQANCGAGDTSVWTGPISFATSCLATDLPFTQDFESVTTPDIPNCGSLETNTGDYDGNGWYTSNVTSYGFSSNVLTHNWSSSGSPDMDDWYFTQGINLEAGVNYQISFTYGSNSTLEEKLKVAFGTSPASSAMTDTSNEIIDITFSMSGSEETEQTFHVDQDGVYYIGFQIHSGDNEYYLYVDDISIDEYSGYVYYDNAGWIPSDPNGNATPTDDITIMDGTTDFTSPIEMNNLTVNTGATLNVEGAMTLNGELLNNGNIVFKSDDGILGQLDNMTGVPINGDGSVTVERHIHARDDGKGAYRYLASAVSSSGNIDDDWQEGASSMANPNPGYGMFITGEGGAANGFDTTPANAPSLFRFDNTNQVYVAIDNTDEDQLSVGMPYTAYVWGDRSVDILTSNDPTATSTTLRATGDLAVNDQTYTALSDVAGGFSLVGNPYQAIVDINGVLTASTNLNTNLYYVWDPNLGTRGAYATVDLAGTTTTPSASAANQYVMPGQAFWVVTASSVAGTSITFNETDKAVTESETDVFRAENTDLASIELQLFQADRYANGQSLSDAVRVNFSETGDNAVLLNDAPKLSNMDENLARTNGTELLSVENRAFPLDGEVLPLNNEQYRVSNYVFKALVNNLPAGTTAYLLDNYLGTQTELTNNEATPVEFSVDVNIPASIASDRFSLVFSKNTMGVDSNLLTDGLSIYPNPVKNGQFFIATSGLSGEKVQVSLYNILGQKVYVSSETVNSDNRVNVPTTSLEAGVYLVEMNHNGKLFTGKVVVE